MTAVRFDGSVALALNAIGRRRPADWHRAPPGAELVYDDPEQGFCELATPMAGVALVLSEATDVPAGGGVVPTFGMTDIDRARGLPEAAGARFEGDTEHVPGVHKLLTMHDDGNVTMPAQDLQARTG